MKSQYFQILILTILFACNPDKERAVDKDNQKFETKDPNRLFFKNVRQLYYHLKEENDGKIQILSLKSRVEEPERPTINVDLINNWYLDKAFPMLVFSSHFDSLDQINIKIFYPDGANELLIFDKSAPMNDHFSVVTTLYNAILKNATFEAMDLQTPLFTDKDEKDGFRITMVDYYRLVGIY